jgi:subtilisin family serine protease
MFRSAGRRQQLRALTRITIAAGMLLAGRPAAAIVGGGPPTFFANVNETVGATQFYDLGFFGSRAIVTNIEAGSIWNLHETLAGRVSQYIADPAIVATGTTQLGQFDYHATAVGQAIGGLGAGYWYQVGVAPTARLWSGAIATSWNPEPFSGSFDVTDESFLYPYLTSMRTGIVSGATTLRTNVVNSSWGYTDPAGTNAGTIAIDALARENNVIVVMSAGNDGPSAGTVGGPASGYNGISVAATLTGTTAPFYGQVASFSSRGPGDFTNPVTGTTTTAVRSTVDIAAPGSQLALAAYLGHTGGNLTGTNGNTGATDLYFQGAAGTSFASPLVAGGAALMIDAATFVAPALPFTSAEMLDARVIKAALMTSATAPAGWSNGQQDVGGVITTTQALDAATGAGLLDLAAAYRVYVGDPVVIGSTLMIGEGTSLGVIGSGGGSGLELRGWDLGSVLGQTGGGPGTANTYAFAQPLTAGFNRIVATVTWFADRTLGDTLDSAADTALADLTLQLIRTDAPGGEQLVAQSIAPYGTTEFLRTYIPESGSYALRVVGLDPVYNTTGGPLTTDYAIAWAIVPEPPTWALLAGTALLPLIIRMPRRPSGRHGTNDVASLTSDPRGPCRPDRPPAAAQPSPPCPRSASGWRLPRVSSPRRSTNPGRPATGSGRCRSSAKIRRTWSRRRACP